MVTTEEMWNDGRLSQKIVTKFIPLLLTTFIFFHLHIFHSAGAFFFVHLNMMLRTLSFSLETALGNIQCFFFFSFFFSFTSFRCLLLNSLKLGISSFFFLLYFSRWQSSKKKEEKNIQYKLHPNACLKKNSPSTSQCTP